MSVFVYSVIYLVCVKCFILQYELGITCTKICIDMFTSLRTNQFLRY